MGPGMTNSIRTLIKYLYWQDKAKPNSCRGYDITWCGECEHSEFCTLMDNFDREARIEREEARYLASTRKALLGGLR